jgi:uncharacterized protein
MKLSKFSKVESVANGLTVLSQSVTINQIFGDRRLQTIAEFLATPRETQSVIGYASQFYSSQEVNALIKMLTEGSFLAQSENDQIFDYIMPEVENRKREYRLLRILLTDVCNLNCSYCKVMPNITDVTKHATSPENLDRAVRIFFEGSEALAPKIIHISGGEPLIAWDRIQYIISLIEAYRRPNERYFVVVGTNALLVDEDRARFFADHGIKAIVSMDGRQEIHDTLRRSHAGKGSFQQVDAGVRLLNRYGVELGLSMVIGKHNVRHLISEIAYILEEYHPVSLGVNYMKPPTKGQIDFPYLIEPGEYVEAMYEAFRTFRETGLFFELVYRRIHPFITKKFRYHDCGAAAGTTINMDAKGNVGPCKSFLVLNTLTQIIAESQSCSTKLPVLDSLQKRSPVYIDECQKCSAVGTCGNACAYEAWVQSGDMMNRDMKACNYTQLFFQKFIDDLAEVVKAEMKNSSFYEPTKSDRLKLLGKIVVNEDTLSSSIGHAADE